MTLAEGPLEFSAFAIGSEFNDTWGGRTETRPWGRSWAGIFRGRRWVFVRVESGSTTPPWEQWDEEPSGSSMRVWLSRA